MPKVVQKRKPASVQPVANEKKTTAATPAMIAQKSDGVLYGNLAVLEYSTSSPTGPLTPTDLKKLLGWETEKEYQQRMVIANPDSKLDSWLFGDNGPIIEGTDTRQPIHCVNVAKEKVVCWHNGNNRPFDSGWCEDLIHTILSGQWAGPHTIPGETVNGETVRISKYGRVLSGQHQATACILADEKLQQERTIKFSDGSRPDSKYPFWDGQEHCFIETLVVTGLSEDERVLQSIDYVKPRSLADMLYTMSLFRQKTSTERKEMTRMLAAAVSLLWDRTATRGYKTHTEMALFLGRHRRLLKCVEHLFVENAVKTGGDGRKISRLNISAGQCSALCYLMGSSGPSTESDEYRNGNPPCEQGLDWSNWERACEFWTKLAKGDGFLPVRTALCRLIESEVDSDDNEGLGGRVNEKLAILALAWELYYDNPNADPMFSDTDLVDDGALCLHYTDVDDKGKKLPEGKIKLIELADFGGIDCPEVTKSGESRTTVPDPVLPSREEQDRLQLEALERRAKAQQIIDQARAKRRQ